MKLKDKVVFVTGAARGIGLGCALACLRSGARVALVDLAPYDGAAQIEQAGFVFENDVLPLTTDVRDADAIQNAVDATVRFFGKLDGVVNNAGWHPPATTIEETSLEHFEALVELNLTSTFLGCKFTIRHLQETHGAIVNMSSEAGVIGQYHAAAYAATKAGQLGLTRALALDLAPEGVRVNAICPAGVRTPLMTEWASTQYDPSAALRDVDSWHPLGRMATTDEIGEVCAFLLSSEAAFITGQAICVDGGAALGYKSR